MIYENGSLKSILVDGGYYENGTYYFYLTGHLGNNRVVANQNGAVIQSTQYYPFGMAFADGTNPSAQPYKFSGKELDSERGLNLYDFHARWQDSALAGRFLSVDPLAEKYYSVSSYAYVANNPVRFVDSDGRDIWELDKDGNIVNRIEDKTQDAFYMVARDADGNYQRTKTTDAEGNEADVCVSFKFGTVIGVKNPMVNVENKDGSITPTELTIFEMKGDDSTTEFFEFLADPERTTNVEWSHGKIGSKGSGRNIVGILMREILLR